MFARHTAETTADKSAWVQREIVPLLQAQTAAEMAALMDAAELRWPADFVLHESVRTHAAGSLMDDHKADVKAAREAHSY